MKLYRHTEVVEVETEEELDRLIQTLQQMKRDAPQSLKLTFAVTVERYLEGVRPVGLLTGSPIPVHPGVALRDAVRSIQGNAQVKTQTPAVQPARPPVNGVSKKALPRPGRRRRSAFAVED